MRCARSLVVLALLAFVGCQADDPIATSPDDVASEPDPLQVAYRENCPAVDPKTYITQVNAPSVTGATLQAVRGYAVGAVDVVARSGNTLHGRADVDSDGRFCIQVNLVPNTQTTVDLIPRAADLCPGQTRQVLITHQYTSGSSTGSVASPIQEPQNVAMGKVVDSPYHTLSDGGGAAIAATDGYVDTYAVFSVFDPLASKAAWLRINLGQSYTISEFRIDWSGDSYATDYRIYTSLAADPGDPTVLNNEDWTQVIEVHGASWGQQQRHVGGVPARWIALVLDADDSFINDTYKVAEFGAYTSTSQQVPIGSSTQDTCP